MDAVKPLRKEGVVTRKLGEECLLYDTQAEAVHVVNLVGALVWGLCDGSHDLADIEDAIRREHDVPDEADVGADVEAVLCEFSRLGLLSDDGEQPHGTD